MTDDPIQTSFDDICRPWGIEGLRYEVFVVEQRYSFASSPHPVQGHMGDRPIHRISSHWHGQNSPRVTGIVFAEKYVPTKLNGKVSLLALKVTDIRISCHGQN